MNYDWSPQLCCPAQLQDTAASCSCTQARTGLGPGAWLKKSISVSSKPAHTTRHLGVWKSMNISFWLNQLKYWKSQDRRWAAVRASPLDTVLHSLTLQLHLHYTLHYTLHVPVNPCLGEVWYAMCVLLKGNPDKIILKHQCLASSLHNWLLAMQLNNLTYHFLSSDPQLQG